MSETATDKPAVIAALLAVMEDRTACAPWPNAVSGEGYGQVWVDGRLVGAHRLAYKYAHGAIPDGLVIDHLCRNRRCINPAHLEAVPQRVNALRGVGITAQNAAKDACTQGHPFTEANTYRRPDRPGSRQCRTCAAAAQRRYHARRVANG